MVVDSGANRSVHCRREDFINFRELRTTISGAIGGNRTAVIGFGDLPVRSRDRQGVWRSLLWRNVRCVPGIPDTLLSVSQTKRQAGVKFDFDAFTMTFPDDGTSGPLVLPFVETADGMYEWHVHVGNSGGSSTVDEDPRSRAHRGLRAMATHHGARTSSHITAMSADDAATCLHRRLLLPTAHLRKLDELTADMPGNAARGHHSPSSFWVEANATKLPHSGTRYKPSHTGRLVHCDLAGPFRRSAVGGYRYMLVCVDDHSRLKRVYFLKHKSDSLGKIRTYVAQMRALLNVGQSEPVNVVSTIHSDGGGEFVSRDFADFCDSEGIEHTTSPPYVSDLNGVAERAIRTIMEMVRAALVSSGAPVSFWDSAANHVVDILNRTTGPPDSNKSAWEVATGLKPKIMGIFPFGCRAYTIKPRHEVSKTGIDAHTWVGINLGCTQSQPGSYTVWLPQYSKVVTTSNVWFDESLMPWRPAGDQRVGPVVPHAAPVETIGGSHGGAIIADESAERLTLEPASSPTAEAFQRVARGSRMPARDSKKVLVLFSGSKRRPDGLATFLLQHGLECEMFDNDPVTGGGAADNIFSDQVFEKLLKRIASGEFLCIIAAPPCSTFSVARHFRAKGDNPGPPPVRNRVATRGRRDQSAGRLAEAHRANELVGRTCALLLAGWRVGTEYVLENPADHGDLTRPRLFINESHCPMWLMAEVIALKKLTSAEECTFPMCMLGAQW